MENFEPRPFGKYFLTDRIAVGGMAEIYKAKTFGVDGFEKVLAIKKILSHYSSDKDFITMLTDEAKLVVNLSHANIVQVYDLGRVGNDYFISMEYIDGINMRDLIERSKELGEPIPPEIVVYIACEVCRGLDYAHNKRDPSGKPLKIVHRDVSPQNILVSYEGGVKIVDFGIAKAAMNLSQTNIGTLKGKVTYMAPEQAFGKPVDGRTDIFSLGIVFYELLTSKRLFHGESQMEILKKIRNTKITKETLNNIIPDALKPILTKALAYSVKDRYLSAADMQVDLNRALYTAYHDVSPRKLAELLHRWFQKELNQKKENRAEANPKNPNETVLVSSTPSQVNLVHREEGQSNPFSDTIKPDDNITKASLMHDPLDQPVELAETTEKSEVTDEGEIPLEELLARKRKKTQRMRLIFLFAILVLIAAYVAYSNYKPHPIEKQLQTDIKVKLPIENQSEKRSILLVSDPSGATVLLNGKALEQNTPVALSELEVGKAYELLLKKDGFSDLSKILTVTNDTEESLSLALTALAPATYSFTINSSPAGALVYLNGEETKQVTPAKLSGLDPTINYAVTLKLKDYKVYEYKLANQDGRDQSLDVKLAHEERAGLILMSHPSGAQVLVDGKDMGITTPATLGDLSLGQNLKITFKKVGYEDLTKPFDITEIKDYSLSVTLKEIKQVETKTTSGLISITTNVAGADVIINNHKVGRTPFKTELAPGRYRIVIKKSLYTSQSKTVSIQENGVEQKLYFELTESGTTTTPITNPVDVNKNIGKVSPDKESNTNFATTGSLRVDSNPRGASVKIDGTNRGVTPIVVSGLPKNKSLSVSVTKSGYKTWQSSVKLVKDKTEMNANLSQ